MGQRSAPQLLEVFQRIGTEGIEPLKKGLQEAGMIMSDELAAKLDSFGDSSERLWGRIQRGAAAAAGFVGEIFESSFATIGAWSAGGGVEDAAQSMRDELEKSSEMAKAARDAETQAMKDALAMRIAAEDAAEREKTAKIMAEHKKRADDEMKRMDAARQYAAKKNEQAAIANAKKAQAAEISVKRKGISAMEEGLRGVESRTGVDQLRNIGANVLGSGTNPWNDTATQMKKQISIAERQLVQLEKIASKDNSEGVF
jgi:hypothetical protein